MTPDIACPMPSNPSRWDAGPPTPNAETLVRITSGLTAASES